MVTARGRDNGRGNYVSVRHANGFTSHYYHLQRFAAGLRTGQRVEQGQVLGAVGSTGLSTGPHLHYGLLKNGRFLNPLRLQSPSVAPLPAPVMDGFRKYCDHVCLPLARGQKPIKVKMVGSKVRPLPGLHAPDMGKTGSSGNGRDG
jgi:murein DD-endopeptidase MepM/ murein hydrolase activator NlpD